MKLRGGREECRVLIERFKNSLVIKKILGCEKVRVLFFGGAFIKHRNIVELSDAGTAVHNRVSEFVSNNNLLYDFRQIRINRYHLDAVHFSKESLYCVRVFAERLV